jgi:hypothetical protein
VLAGFACAVLTVATVGQVQAAGPHNVWKEVAAVTNSDGAYDTAAASGDTNGIIYFVGGSNGYYASTDVEGYNPTTNQWASITPMPEGMASQATAAGLKGLLFSIGGLGPDDSNGAGVDTVYAYSPSRKAWITEPPMPTARYSLAAATGPDGRIYAIGGANATGVLNVVEAFNPTTATWSTVAPLPIASADLSAVTGPDGRIYAINWAMTPTGNGVVDAYDVYTNIWTPVASVPMSEVECAAAASDGRIYAVESTVKAPKSATATSPTFAYQASTNTWTKVASMPWRWGAVCASLPTQPHIYAMGGASLEGYYPHPETTNTVLRYTA